MRMLHGLALGAVATVNGACFTYVARADASSPNPGQRVALQVSDQGRVDLAERLGPGVDRVEGTLVSLDSDQYVMSITKVQNVRRQSNYWAGERVPIRRANVARLEERKFSLGRTSLLVGSTAAAVAVLVASNALQTIGIIGDNGGPGGEQQGSLRP